MNKPYNLINVVVQILFLGTKFATITGIFSGLTIIIFTLFSTQDPNILAILCVLIGFVPLALFLGGIIGAFLGIVMSLVNAINISCITVGFSEHNLFLRYKLEYRLLILFISTPTNIFIWLLICNQIYWDAKLFGLGVFGIVIGSVFANLHYIQWFYTFLGQHPEFLNQIKINSSQAEFNPTNILGNYDKYSYKMPPLPADLTQYTDGELPAELLRQFPIDRE